MDAGVASLILSDRFKILTQEARNLLLVLRADIAAGSDFSRNMRSKGYLASGMTLEDLQEATKRSRETCTHSLVELSRNKLLRVINSPQSGRFFALGTFEGDRETWYSELQLAQDAEPEKRTVKSRVMELIRKEKARKQQGLSSEAQQIILHKVFAPGNGVVRKTPHSERYNESSPRMFIQWYKGLFWDAFEEFLQALDFGAKAVDLTFAGRFITIAGGFDQAKELAEFIVVNWADIKEALTLIDTPGKRSLPRLNFLATAAFVHKIKYFKEHRVTNTYERNRVNVAELAKAPSVGW